MVARLPRSVRKVASQSSTSTLPLGCANASPKPTAGARSMQSFRSTSRSRRCDTRHHSRRADDVATTTASFRWKLTALVASIDGIKLDRPPLCRLNGVHRMPGLVCG